MVPTSWFNTNASSLPLRKSLVSLSWSAWVLDAPDDWRDSITPLVWGDCAVDSDGAIFPNCCSSDKLMPIGSSIGDRYCGIGMTDDTSMPMVALVPLEPITDEEIALEEKATIVKRVSRGVVLPMLHAVCLLLTLATRSVLVCSSECTRLSLFYSIDPNWCSVFGGRVGGGMIGSCVNKGSQKSNQHGKPSPQFFIAT